MIAPSASIVIPTRDRLAYLQVALESIAPQAAQEEAELLVVDDAGPSLGARELAARFGARYEPRAPARPQRCAQHGPGAHARGADRVRRRRRSREARLARGADARRARAPRGRRVHGPD